MKAVVVAGTHSGAGKTTVTLALIAALRTRGMRLAAFKAGPDFIDAAHLARVSGGECINLDGWMLGHEACQRSFHAAARGHDVAIVEGVMGLFDGARGAGESGSTAELAKWLGLPVILVADAAGAARSLAATAHGFQTFDPALRVAGIICNRVGSAGHAEYLREALTANPVLGFGMSDDALRIPERHLGLTLPQEGHDPDIGALAEWGERNLALDRILELAAEVGPCGEAAAALPEPTLRMGVARDAAFCFYYPENLARLRMAGVELVEFSPLRDRQLPAKLDGLYLGGGYPELHAAALSTNAGMRASVLAFARGGGFIYAECGGLMYLTRELADMNGQRHAMAAVLDCAVTMQHKLAGFGYREVTPVGLGLPDARARGHEFHYSKLEPGTEAYAPVHQVHGAEAARAEGMMRGNVAASYIHLHFGSCPELASAMARRMTLPCYM